MPIHVPDYNQLLIHEVMLNDDVRTRSFLNAIEQVVERGDVVLDLGSGTGFFSLVAVRSGADKVYAVERASIAKVAKRIMEDNDYSDHIVVFENDVTDGALREAIPQVDLIISECLGVHVFQENMIHDLLFTRDHFLKENGKMIPKGIQLFISPIHNVPTVSQRILRWKGKFHGFDFSELFFLAGNDIYVDTIEEEQLTHQGKPVLDLQFKTMKYKSEVRLNAIFEFTKDDSVQGICGWFVADLTDDIKLDTSPDSPPTHWQQTVYPINPSISVKAGDTLSVDIIIEPERGYTNFTWSANIINRAVKSIVFSTKNNYTMPGLKNSVSGININNYFVSP